MGIYQQFLATANSGGWSCDEALQFFALAAFVLGTVFSAVSIGLLHLLKVYFQKPPKRT